MKMKRKVSESARPTANAFHGARQVHVSLNPKYNGWIPAASISSQPQIKSVNPDMNIDSFVFPANENEEDNVLNLLYRTPAAFPANGSAYTPSFGTNSSSLSISR